MKKSVKQLTTKELVKRALKNKPKWKPSKGYVHLVTIKIGSLVETSSKTRAVLLAKSPSSATVYVTEYKGNEDSYYIGKHLWSLHTEVKEIK